jgi:hypothetical protein
MVNKKTVAIIELSVWIFSILLFEYKKNDPVVKVLSGIRNKKAIKLVRKIDQGK